MREGRFQKQMAVATVALGVPQRIRSWYSHYKNNFRYKAQWTPVIMAPMLAAAGIGAVRSRPRCAYLASRRFGSGHARRRHWLCLSRARTSAAARRYEKADLQHHLRAADFRPAAVCRRRGSGIAGQLAAERAEERVNWLSMAGPSIRVPGEPIGPLAQPGYYPDSARSASRSFWDAKTREVVLDRVENVPSIRFFDAASRRSC